MSFSGTLTPHNLENGSAEQAFIFLQQIIFKVPTMVD